MADVNNVTSAREPSVKNITILFSRKRAENENGEKQQKNKHYNKFSLFERVPRVLLNSARAPVKYREEPRDPQRRHLFAHNTSTYSPALPSEALDPRVAFKAHPKNFKEKRINFHRRKEFL